MSCPRCVTFRSSGITVLMLARISVGLWDAVFPKINFRESFVVYLEDPLAQLYVEVSLWDVVE